MFKELDYRFDDRKPVAKVRIKSVTTRYRPTYKDEKVGKRFPSRCRGNGRFSYATFVLAAKHADGLLRYERVA